MKSDKILPQFFFDKKYEVYIPTRDDWRHNNVVLHDDIICFIDGSRIKSYSQSGAGLFNYTDSEDNFLSIWVNLALCFRLSFISFFHIGQRKSIIPLCYFILFVI